MIDNLLLVSILEHANTNLQHIACPHISLSGGVLAVLNNSPEIVLLSTTLSNEAPPLVFVSAYYLFPL